MLLACGMAAAVTRDVAAVAPVPSARLTALQDELEQAARRGGLCGGRNAIGVGLRGEYFAAAGLAGVPLLVRTDAVVDFDASLDWPAGGPRPVRSVRWTGWVKAPVTGRYRFHVGVPSAHITVGKDTFAGDGSDAPADLTLYAGRFYPIRVEVANLEHPSPLQLEWTAPHGARYVVPRALLHLPTETAAPRA